MKAWTVSELDNVVGSLKALLGARLQEVMTSGNDAVFGFYSPDGLMWLWIDMNALKPCLLPWTELPLRFKSQKSPLNLFMRAHFVDRILSSVSRSSSEGRVVRLVFGTKADSNSELEIRLFPHGRNVIARSGGKQVAWAKPRELKTTVTETPLLSLRTQPSAETASALIPMRTLEDLRREWLASRQGRGGGASGKVKDPRSRLSAELARKEKALEKVREELKRKQEQPWKKVGDWLKNHQSLDVPKEFEPFVDRRRKLSWNIEQAYQKAREIEGKVFGTEQRLELLVQEIDRVRTLLARPPAHLGAEPEKVPARPLKDHGIEAQGRTLRISDELVVVAGKSAHDNLQLLRKARSWDLWIHLRDYPSSHAILFRNKNTPVNDAVLRQVMDWFLRQHFGQKHPRHIGERFDVLVAECRYVRPIKGDKVGRVTFQNERVLIYKIPD